MCIIISKVNLMRSRIQWQVRGLWGIILLRVIEEGEGQRQRQRRERVSTGLDFKLLLPRHPHYNGLYLQL